MRSRTAAGEAALEALAADPARALVALDYDGTLAPVVDRPEDAVAAPGAVEALQDLSGQVGRIVLITGRPAQVAVRLGRLDAVPGLVVAGQYGAERWEDGRLTVPDELPGVARLRAALPELVRAEGADVEDKGLSLVVHTRRCADPHGALERLRPQLQRQADAVGLELHPGRFVLELRPPGFDKRGALLALADPLPSAVVFAGDDRGDLAAYDAVDELRGRGVPGLLVCSASDEGPPELQDRADVVVDGPTGVVALLRDLVAGR